MYLYNKHMKRGWRASTWLTGLLFMLVLAIAYVIYAHPDLVVGGFK